MTDTLRPTRSGHAPINGLKMYYEIHGETRPETVPLVLLHGGISTIATDFGQVLPALAATRQVIGVEQQGHGHTADIDRPLTFEQIADDTAAMLRHLGAERVDVFGFSDGAGAALRIAIRYPELLRKQVIASGSYSSAGLHPGLVGGMEKLQPEMLYGTPYHDAYLQVAPDPEQWPALIDRIKQMDSIVQNWPAEDIRAITAPTLLIFGDSDIVQPEHAVEMFRLLGGGVPGDMVPMPNSQLAILPGTSHIGVMNRPDLLLAMVPAFLDAPMPAG